MQNRQNQDSPPNSIHSSWTARLRARHIPIAYKLSLVFSLIITIGMGLLGLIVTSNQSHLLEQQMQIYAGSMVKQLADSASEPILANDDLALTVMINNLVDHEGVIGASIYSKEAQPLVSSGLIPGSGILSFTNSAVPLLWSTADAEPRLLSSFIAPVQFRDYIVGYALLTFDRRLLDQSRQITVTTIITSTLLMVLFGIIIAIVVGKRLVRPIHQLIDGSMEISSGNYLFRFSERRNDELGLLMRSLNTMSDGLLRKEQVEQAFSRYVSPNVASELLNDLDQISLGGRHVEATVMFADIVGFTGLSEKLPPQEINSLLNEYFTLIDDAAHSYHGHVDKYMGDCAMLLFGVPEEDGNHIVHAVYCALLIQKLAAVLNQKRGTAGLTTVEFRIGINSGIMLAGNMGSVQRMEYTVVGDSVNLASRLSSVASAGEIIVCDTVHEMAGLNKLFFSSKYSTIHLRGMSEPVATYRILGVRGDDEKRKMDELLKRLSARGRTV